MLVINKMTGVIKAATFQENFLKTFWAAIAEQIVTAPVVRDRRPIQAL